MGSYGWWLLYLLLQITAHVAFLASMAGLAMITLAVGRRIEAWVRNRDSEREKLAEHSRELGCQTSTLGHWRPEMARDQKDQVTREILLSSEGTAFAADNPDQPLGTVRNWEQIKQGKGFYSSGSSPSSSSMPDTDRSRR